MKQIKKLTPEQEAILPQVRDEWLRIGLSTEPADRPKAEAGIRATYRAAGLEPPKLIVWLSSPYAGAIGTWMLCQVGGQVGDQVWGQVENQVWDQVGRQVEDQVWDQVEDQVEDEVRGQVKGQVKDQLNMSMWGQHEAHWVAWADAMSQIGVKGIEKRLGLDAVARSAGWWWSLRGAAIVTDRPETLHRDDQGRLHCETGPAMRYRDGWAIYRWHGTRVPASLVEDGWDIERILKERNAEVRRCAIERLGWDRFVVEAKLAPVGPPSPDPGNPGQDLTLYDVPSAIYDEPIRVLLCTNGTPERDGTRRRFGITVPADVTDPVSAAAWTYGLRADQYAATQRRA